MSVSTFWYLQEEIFNALSELCHNVIIIIIIIIIIDRLVGLVVSMSDYWSWGRGFDPRYFYKF